MLSMYTYSRAELLPGFGPGFGLVPGFGPGFAFALASLAFLRTSSKPCSSSLPPLCHRPPSPPYAVNCKLHLVWPRLPGSRQRRGVRGSELGESKIHVKQSFRHRSRQEKCTGKASPGHWKGLAWPDVDKDEELEAQNLGNQRYR